MEKKLQKLVKTMDYLERAKREEAAPLIEAAFQQRLVEEKALHEHEQQQAIEVSRQRHDGDLREKNRMARMLDQKVDAVVYLVDANDKERFAESKKERDALLSDEALANVLFLVLGNKINIPYAASEDELHHHVGLTHFPTGKGKVNLADSNVRPLEVLMCSIVHKMGYGDGFKWLSQ